MRISFSTANFYFLPFEETLEIIAEAGFQHIELDLPWEWKQWAMAQHLRDVPVSQAIRSIHQSGLKVTSIHDGGGVVTDRNSTAGYINPRLDEYLGQLGYAPEYMVFHPPQVEGNQDAGWWDRMAGKFIRTLDLYRSISSLLTIENEPFFEDLFVPLTTPEELRAFVIQNGLGVTVDTTHYAYMGTNIIEAARILEGNIRSVHLSDYTDGRPHTFVGEGELDLNGFIKLISATGNAWVTLECSLSTADRSDRQMSHVELVNRMKVLKAKVESLPIGEP